MQRSHARRSAWLAAAVVALAACAAIPMRPRGEWLSARTPHFEIVSGLSAKRTRTLAGRLEHFRAVALGFGDLESPSIGVPTRVVLFPRTRNFAALRPHRALSGYFQPTAHANYLAIDAEDPAASLQIAQHELVHLLQLGDASAETPAWFREGLADLLASASLDDAAAEIGAPPPGHLALARAAPLPLARVLGARDVLRWKRGALESFYAQAWALTHHLMLGESAPARATLRRFVAELAAGREADRACRDVLGRSLDQLERDVLAYVERDDLPRVRIAAARRASAPIALAPLPDAERDALLGDLALSFGERRFRRAESLLRAALARDPDHAQARATVAWLAALRADPGAEAAIASGEAIEEPDAETERRLGEAWLAWAWTAPALAHQRERLARAEAHFARSLALAPASPAATLGLARSAAARGDAERARGELAVAQRALPALPALRFELARGALEAGDAQAARAALGPTLADPHATPPRPAEREALSHLLQDAGLGPASPASGRHLAARLDVQSPGPGAAAATDLPFFELRGKAGFWEAALQDLAIALDVSNSTLDAAGIDVDRDGRVGRSRRSSILVPSERRGSSDRGDSIVRAEIAAAERLLAELDPATTRVALVLFTASARVAAPLGAPADALAALRGLRVRYDPTGTSFAEPLERAFEELIERRRPGERSQRTIVMLSDGEPTAPSRPEARRRALESSERLARFGVRVHGFALGESAADKSETLREIAERTGGRFSAAVDLGDVSFLRDVRLTGLERVSLRNRSSGEPARAVRTFADGSFDAIVPLAPGENTIEVRAELEGQGPLLVTRRVQRTPPVPGDRSYDARAAALRDALRERTQQLVARARLESERSRQKAEHAAEQRRALDITPREVSSPPPARLHE